MSDVDWTSQLADQPMAALVLHINREMVHHGAEIARPVPVGVRSGWAAVTRSWRSPVRINGLVPMGSKRLDNAGLPGPRHAGQQDPLHSREPTAADERVGPWAPLVWQYGGAAAPS